jgi:restriction system protein
VERQGRNPILTVGHDVLAALALPFLLAAQGAHALASRVRRWKPFSRPGHSAGRPEVDTSKWTLELLKRIEWRRFEELYVAYFQALGFRAQAVPSRADGGADISLAAEGSESASILVRCKAWDTYTVGIQPLRALRAAMTSGKYAEGVFVTSGRFTREARDYAAREQIHLIDGPELLGKIGGLVPEKALALLKFTTQGEFLTPTCPSCGIKMISRKSTPGGRNFWACRNYPRCKQTFFGVSNAPA